MTTTPNEVVLPWPPKGLSPNARLHWTSEEDLFLHQNWKSMSHLEMGASLGRAVAGVRNRCYRLGLVDTSDNWTKVEIDALRKAYESGEFDVDINLPELANLLGRDKSNVCRKARLLGLTDKARKVLPLELKKIRKPKFSSKEALLLHLSQSTKNRILKQGHPRGMAGKHHSNKTKEAMSKRAVIWNANRTPEEKANDLMKSMKTKIANGTYVRERPNASWKAGWREIGGTKKYYRSKWEANYAYYLEWLKTNGQISDWMHEPVTFWFSGVKRGCVSYLPDFWVQEKDGSEAYHEVKGWMDDRSKTKIRRMAKYHPGVKLIVIDSKGYAALKKSVHGLVPGWES